jgi:hypothetical protein
VHIFKKCITKDKRTGEKTRENDEKNSPVYSKLRYVSNNNDLVTPVR